MAGKVPVGGGLHALAVKCVSALNGVEAMFLSARGVSFLLAGLLLNL